MTRSRNRLHTLGIGGMIVGLIACGSGDEGWIARVDGVSISFELLRQGFDRRLEVDPEAEREELLSQELNRLLSEQVIVNRARQLGVEVSVPEVEARLESIHGEQPREDPQFLANVRKEMLLRRTALTDLAPRIRVQESTLVHYFEDHRDEYHEPEKVRLRQIVVEEESPARALVQRLEQGEDFASLAAEHSLAPEASQGGLLPPFAKGEMPEVFDAAFDLEPGEVSDVLESPYGFHVFLLEDRIPAREAELDDVRSKLRSDLEQKRFAQLEKEWIRELRRVSTIEVNDRLLEELR